MILELASGAKPGERRGGRQPEPHAERARGKIDGVPAPDHVFVI